MKTVLLRILYSVSLLLLSGYILAQAPTGYYTNVDGKKQAALKTAFYNIIKSPSVTSYDGLWTSFKTTDKKSNGKVWDMYSDVPNGTPAYVYSFGTNQCGSYSGEGSCYNREHSFPKSWFNDASPMVSDVFHLYPTDGYVNGKRSNYPFGEVGIATWTSTNGSKLGKNTSDGYTGTVFEPIDEYKGDFARTYFYMATCYEDKIAGWYGNSVAQAALNGTKYPAYKDWYIKLMLKWSREDPVSQKEIDRNNAAYAIQKNRNPYIDFPGLEEYVWGTKQDIAFNSNNPGGTDPRISVEPTALAFSSNDINVTSSQTINIKAYNLTGDLQAALSGDNVFTTTSSTISKDAAESSAGYNLTVDFKPTAYANNSGVLSISGGGLSTATTVNLTGVTSAFSGEVLSVPFKTTLNPFTQYSVLGTQVWTQDATNGYAKMSGYVTTNYQNEDWLISPSIDLSDFISATLTFNHTGKMFNALPTMKSDLTLWVSSNYASGAPATATWSQLTIPNYMTGADWIFVSSGNIALDPLLDKANARFAFKYVSTNSYAGNWEIKDVLVVGAKRQSSIDDSDADGNIPVYVTPGYLNIYVYSDTESISLYDALGKQLVKQKANLGENHIAVAANQLLFVKVGNRVTKVLSK